MPDSLRAFAAALAALMLASCARGEPTVADNVAFDADAYGLENASPSEPGQVNTSDAPDADAVPPPDAVSHPDGYLPNASDLPPPTAPEPATDKEKPPATEDDYIRNRQSGS